MINSIMSPEGVHSVEAVLREDLAHGDAMLGTVAPVLRHLLTSGDQSMFSDEVVARLRGMTGDLARQLLGALSGAEGKDCHDGHEIDAARCSELTDMLAATPALLGHLHVLALEWQLGERLQSRLALDPVVSPLLQALISSGDADTSAHAMNFLAAQARFCQAQRRMTIPLGELPGDLLHACLMALRAYAQECGQDEAAARAEAGIRSRYDEAASRLGLITRLVAGMGAGAVAALSFTHAGLAIFASALALGSGQERELALLAMHESQTARLALALRAAGLKPRAMEEQFLALHPDVVLPDGLDGLDSGRAAAILAGSGRLSGD